MSRNGAAGDVAATRPWPAGTLFCLLHIVVPVYPPLIVPRVFEKSNKTLLEQLGRAAEPLERAGWSVQTTVLAGSPRRTINAFAKGWQADLIMVGSHERSSLARLCLGGTAQCVMRHAPCSVEIVRSRRRSSGSAGDHRLKILVATDGSEFSAAALRSVAKRPWPDGSELKVISVPEFILTKEASYLTTDEIREIGDLGAAAIEDAKRCIATGKETLSGSPLSVSAEVPDYQDRPYPSDSVRGGGMAGGFNRCGITWAHWFRQTSTGKCFRSGGAPREMFRRNHSGTRTSYLRPTA